MAIDMQPDALSGFAGELIAPGDPSYDHRRSVWNGTIDRRPAVIARARGVADIVLALAAARERGLQVAVRGGGHNVAGTAVADDALVIDLSAMNGVRVDPVTRTAWIQAGATWGDVDRATQIHGLAAPGGVVSSTGVTGLALSGGYSWQRRRDGMTIDNIAAFEVVTTDGRVLRASEHEHPDLYWALRGGGGGFAIVTAIELRLHPLGPDVAHVYVAYPIERASEILAGYRALVDDHPDELTADFLIWTFPDVEELPEHVRGRPFAGIAGMYAGPIDEGWKAIAPLRELGEPLADLSREVPYLELQSALDPFFPTGLRYFWKSLYLDEVTGAPADLMLEMGEDRPSPATLLVLRHLGGAISRVDDGATPFADRDARFLLSLDSTWAEPEHDDMNIGWTRQSYDRLVPHSRASTYFNFASDLVAEGETIARTTFGAAYDRLAQVKAAYDPEDVLSLAPGVRPAR